MDANQFYKISQIREQANIIVKRNKNHYLVRYYKNLIIGLYETFLIQETWN